MQASHDGVIARVAEAMSAQGLTVAAAESLTCGRVQAFLGSLSGSSRYFVGGVTAYSLKAKTSMLGVDEEHARTANCVSERVALEMARGVAHLFGAHYAVATTGYAESDQPLGIHTPFAFCAIWNANGSRVIRVDLSQELDRASVQELVALHAIQLLDEWLTRLLPS